MTTAREYPVTVIPLAGPVTDRDSEISGLAWYVEHLILLPQYPGRLGDNVFALSKQEILSFLDGSLSGPLTPRAIPLVAPNLNKLRGFQGLEAIAFVDNQVFVTIETSLGASMLGYLAAGSMAPDLSVLRLDTTNLAKVQPQANISNLSEETLLVSYNTLVTIFEGNGSNVNPAPVAHQFDTSLAPLGTVPLPNIEYRITDATALDATDRFWAINYLFPGEIDKLDPAPDALFTQHGIGPTHARSRVVERLVEFQYSKTGITLTDTPPLQLELLGDDTGRNWEGVARLDERGFLLVTDKFPETILGFVRGHHNHVTF